MSIYGIFSHVWPYFLLGWDGSESYKSGKSKSARGEKRKVIFPAKTKSVSKMIERAPKNIYFDAHSF